MLTRCFSPNCTTESAETKYFTGKIKRKTPVTIAFHTPMKITFLKNTSRSAGILQAINQHPFRNTRARFRFLIAYSDQLGGARSIFLITYQAIAE